MGAVGAVGIVGAVGAVGIVGAVATSSQQRGRAFAKRPYITYYKSC